MNSDRIRTRILTQLNQWLEVVPEPDEALIGFGSEDAEMSPRQIVKAVEKRTPFGEQLVDRWVDLAVDHIVSSALEIEDAVKDSSNEDDLPQVMAIERGASR